MIKQKQAVVDAVATVLGGDFTPGTTVVKDAISKEQKSEIRSLVFAGIMDGTVGFNGSLDDEKEISRYVNSMVDNHFRKAKELNGGNTYKPASTGTRRDPQLREMNKLLRTFTEGSEEFSQIQEHIELRNGQLDEIRTQKRNAASVGPIDTDALPPHLRSLVNGSSLGTAEASAE